MQENEKEIEIDLMRLLLAMWRKIWIIVGCTLVAGIVALAVTHHFITPMYQAEVSIYVDNSTRSEADEQYISSSSLSTAQKLVKTYVTILESDTVLDKVAATGNLELSAKEIRKMMSASSVNDTEIFRIYITHESPELAAQLANAIADVAPDQISRFLAGSSTKVIDYAKVPEEPISPSLLRNTALGALIGAFLVMAVICVAEIMDNRIVDEEQLERLFSRPVLGTIPDFNSSSKADGYYAYDYNAKHVAEGQS